MRESELINLKWSDYNEDEGTIVVRKSKTINGLRKLPLNSVMKEIILNQSRENEYIFCQKNGKKITETVLKKTYLRIRKKTKIKNFTIHKCRHTFATRLVEKRVDLTSISKLLGHSNPKFTAKAYIHPEIEHLRKQIYMLDKKDVKCS